MPGSEIFFSVIIPTRNRAGPLGRCLDAIARIDYPTDNFEVIVVDDASRERLDAVVEARQVGPPVRLLRQEHSGPAAARNRGAAAAKGEWLVFIDDDCRPAPTWLRTFASHISEDDEAFGGAARNGLPDNPFSAASHELVEFVCGWLFDRDSPLGFVPSNNFAVSAERFRQLEGFAREFPSAAAEDRDFCCRWLESGGRIRLARDALIDHEHPLGPVSFWRQHFNYGRGARIFHERRVRRTRAPVQLLPVGYYAALLAHPWRKLRGWPALRQSGLLAISQAANAAGYFFQRVIRSQRRDRQ